MCVEEGDVDSESERGDGRKEWCIVECSSLEKHSRHKQTRQNHFCGPPIITPQLHFPHSLPPPLHHPPQHSQKRNFHFSVCLQRCRMKRPIRIENWSNSSSSVCSAVTFNVPGVHLKRCGVAVQRRYGRRSESKEVEGSRRETKNVEGSRRETKEEEGCRLETRNVEGCRRETRNVEGCRLETRNVEGGCRETRNVEGCRRETKEEEGCRRETKEEEGCRRETKEEEGCRRETRNVEGCRRETKEEEGCRLETRNVEGCRRETKEEEGCRRETKEEEGGTTISHQAFHLYLIKF
ncbi:hypothetical protein BLNAU_19939 [Blattamonas nauphoetae]|uniref:Uncharacterized protein n=1 Tax=Blattamonas nauphoetae TaxID=2049346 RepID=A0ABQ9X055_9EUKA|nr:hypothetical protein BLNAU_19939 [Blattamonas nauphoetae]